MKGTLCAETAIMRVQVPIDDSETLPRPFGHSDETRILGKVGHQRRFISLYLKQTIYINRIGAFYKKKDFYYSAAENYMALKTGKENTPSLYYNLPMKGRREVDLHNIMCFVWYSLCNMV